jgi:hypothetical protein
LSEIILVLRKHFEHSILATLLMFSVNVAKNYFSSIFTKFDHLFQSGLVILKWFLVASNSESCLFSLKNSILAVKFLGNPVENTAKDVEKQFFRFFSKF